MLNWVAHNGFSDIPEFLIQGFGQQPQNGILELLLPYGVGLRVHQNSGVLIEPETLIYAVPVQTRREIPVIVFSSVLGVKSVEQSVPRPQVVQVVTELAVDLSFEL